MAISTSRTPHLVRSLSSLAVATKLTTQTPTTTATTTTPPPPLDLKDTEKLFTSIPTTALARSLLALQALAIDPLVDAATSAMCSPAVMGNSLGRAAVTASARATVYGHFCAGETEAEAARAVHELNGRGLRAILDYGMEDAEDDASCDLNADGFLKSVAVAAALPDTSTNVCLKITALSPIALLERISDLLRWQQKHPSFKLPWKAHSFPILSDSSPLYLTASEPQPLSYEEEQKLHLALQRLTRICEECVKADVMLLIDAEYATLQPAIDYFTYLAALQFNKERAVVYGTIQAYLRDSKERLSKMVDAAEVEGMSIGLKLVRGAYLTRETQLAASLGVPSPIHDSIQETHRCYNSCASFLLERLRRGTGGVVLATHNVESGQLAAAKSQELGLAKYDQSLQFAQLMGMADGLSLALKNAGFQVSKYLPYGPVDKVIPYLVRRAEENRGFLSSSAFDRQLLRKELTRRLKIAVLGG